MPSDRRRSVAKKQTVTANSEQWTRLSAMPAFISSPVCAYFFAWADDILRNVAATVLVMFVKGARKPTLRALLKLSLTICDRTERDAAT
ncbi:MAG TPA: hypothetical protein DC047_11760 [Blastocatellia bacterium]|nr:hypothetical protein [Blastocatellia bacterium]